MNEYLIYLTSRNDEFRNEGLFVSLQVPPITSTWFIFQGTQMFITVWNSGVSSYVNPSWEGDHITAPKTRDKYLWIWY